LSTVQLNRIETGSLRENQMMQRRAVLAALGSAMAVSVVPVQALAGTKLSERELYSDNLGGRFKFKGSGGEVTTARLVAVDDGPRCRGLEQFSVAFEGEGVTEGLFEMDHPELGRSQIALFRCGPPGAGRNRCRAYFSKFA
jgi:hypothetical protein